MAYLSFDSSYAPCGFLIVRDGCEDHDDKNTALIQSDWDFPEVAQTCGWSLARVSGWIRNGRRYRACRHEATDGTVTCRTCGRTPTEFISAAYDWLRQHDGETFGALDVYLDGE